MTEIPFRPPGLAILMHLQFVLRLSVAVLAVEQLLALRRKKEVWPERQRAAFR